MHISTLVFFFTLCVLGAFPTQSNLPSSVSTADAMSSSSLSLASEVSTSLCTTAHSDVTYSKEFLIGLLLAISSSAFIGTSFIVKKKGLLRYILV